MRCDAIDRREADIFPFGAQKNAGRDCPIHAEASDETGIEGVVFGVSGGNFAQRLDHIIHYRFDQRPVVALAHHTDDRLGA
jgi:hypothetical protein